MHKQPKFGKVKTKLTYDAVNFTMMCLNKDPRQRPSAKKLLEHAWFSKNAKESILDSDTKNQIAADLKEFRNKSEFQTGVASLLTQARV